MESQVQCEICGRGLPPIASYIVRIDVLADPSMPSMTWAQIQQIDFDAELAKLMDEMRDMSAEELQDQVHRHFEYRLCRACQIRFLANPLGKPRQNRPSGN